MPNATKTAQTISRLLSNTPSPSHADARSRSQTFLTVASQFSNEHLDAAVDQILEGLAEECKPGFAVYPPQLVAVARRIRDKGLAYEALHRSAVLQITERSKEFHQQPADVRRKAVADGLARLAAGREPPETPEQAEARKAETARRLAAHDRRFHANDTDEAKLARLMSPRR